jgi:hypothetical protein
VCLLVGRSVAWAALAGLLLGALQALPTLLPAGPGATLLGALPWLVALHALAAARSSRLSRTWRSGALL